MTKLERLINELCPNGVEYKMLGEICSLTRGVRLVKSQLALEGKYPVYQNSMTPLGYHENSNCHANTVFIISAGAAGEIGYSTVDFWAADDCFYFVCPEHLFSRYLYYALLCQQGLIISRVRRASVPRLARSVVEQLKIPLPPLPIQKEIVRLLDRFSELTSELETNLTAELTARKKQYEYYRNFLLTFDNISDIINETADSRQQTADSRQQTADSRQQTADVWYVGCLWARLVKTSCQGVIQNVTVTVSILYMVQQE